LTLCIDIGNTNVCLALGTPENYTQARALTEGLDFVRFVEESFGGDVWGKLQDCAVSSVVPQAADTITKALQGLPIRRFDAGKSSVDFSRYKGQLGEDRAICCQTAVLKHGAPLILADLGTATTINVVDDKNIFLGGAIHAGVQTGLDALNSRTAQLPPVSEFPGAIKLIGEDTVECLISGAVMGTVFLIEGYVRRVGELLNLGREPVVVLTGGNAPPVAAHFRSRFVHEPELLLEGLFLI